MLIAYEVKYEKAAVMEVSDVYWDDVEACACFIPHEAPNRGIKIFGLMPYEYENILDSLFEHGRACLTPYKGRTFRIET